MGIALNHGQIPNFRLFFKQMISNFKCILTVIKKANGE